MTEEFDVPTGREPEAQTLCGGGKPFRARREIDRCHSLRHQPDVIGDNVRDFTLVFDHLIEVRRHIDHELELIRRGGDQA